MALTGRELRRAQDRVLLLIKSAEQRVAHFPLEMAERARGGNVVELPMVRRDIADYLGLTVETTNVEQSRKRGCHRGLDLAADRVARSLGAPALERLSAAFLRTRASDCEYDRSKIASWA
jgi:hypothetical protein